MHMRVLHVRVCVRLNARQLTAMSGPGHASLKLVFPVVCVSVSGIVCVNGCVHACIYVCVCLFDKWIWDSFLLNTKVEAAAASSWYTFVCLGGRCTCVFSSWYTFVCLGFRCTCMCVCVYACVCVCVCVIHNQFMDLSQSSCTHTHAIICACTSTQTYKHTNKQTQARMHAMFVNFTTLLLEQNATLLKTNINSCITHS